MLFNITMVFIVLSFGWNNRIQMQNMDAKFKDFICHFDGIHWRKIEWVNLYGFKQKLKENWMGKHFF